MNDPANVKLGTPQYCPSCKMPNTSGRKLPEECQFCHGTEKVDIGCPPGFLMPSRTPEEMMDDAQDAQEIEELIKKGHTDHCAKRQVWGDGECECVKPVQVKAGQYILSGRIATPVYMAAYEVYCEVFGPQQAMIEGTCRGGFSSGELVAFLYARSFPKKEWRDRINEALRGMKLL